MIAIPKNIIAALATLFTINTQLKAQYGGQDTTIKITPVQTPATSQKPKAQRTLNPIQKEAMTFMITNNSNALVNTIGRGLQTELEPNFGNVGASEITQKPTTIGYQYHFRDRWTMGVQYTWAQVKSDTLA